MGNLFLKQTKFIGFVRAELGLWAGLNAVVLALPLAILVIYLIVHYGCKYYDNRKKKKQQEENERLLSESSRSTTQPATETQDDIIELDEISSTANTSMLESQSNPQQEQQTPPDDDTLRMNISEADEPQLKIHTVLGYIFPLCLKKKMVQVKEKPYTYKEVLLCADREFPSNKAMVVHVYFYFILATLTAIVWFVTILVENIVYRKTTTCNDINVDNNRYSCFDINNETNRIDCKTTPNIETYHVICYLYQPSFAAVGIAFSTTKAVILAIEIEFLVAVKVADKEYGIAALGLLHYFFFFVLVVSIVYLCSARFAKDIVDLSNRFPFDFYFFYGATPMRIVTYILIALTGLVILIAPWYYFRENNGGYHELAVVGNNKPLHVCNCCNRNQNNQTGSVARSKPPGSKPTAYNPPEFVPAGSNPPGSETPAPEPKVSDPHGTQSYIKS